MDLEREWVAWTLLISASGSTIDGSRVQRTYSEMKLFENDVDIAQSGKQRKAENLRRKICAKKHQFTNLIER